MNTAEKYLKKQLASVEFKRSFLEEKIKLDIEYRLEELILLCTQGCTNPPSPLPSP
jgi:hypothetical protein